MWSRIKVQLMVHPVRFKLIAGLIIFALSPSQIFSQIDTSATIKQISPVQNELDENIKLARRYIDYGDSFFISKQYKEAEQCYTYALKVIKEDAYVSDQISKCRIELERMKQKDQQVIQRQKDSLEFVSAEQQYMRIMRKADSLYNLKKWDDAKMFYDQCRNLRPNDQRAHLGIKRSDSLLSVQRVFEMWRAKANKSFEQKYYEASQYYFDEALKLKPGDPYCTSKRHECSVLLEDQKKDPFYQLKYDQVILKADSCNAKNNLPVARKYYVQAFEMKPQNQFLQDTLNNISSRIFYTQNIERFNYLVRSGDTAFYYGYLNDALEDYSFANSILPGNSDLLQKMDSVETTFKMLQDLNLYEAIDGFNNCIVTIDEVILKHQQALKISPNDFQIQQSLIWYLELKETGLLSTNPDDLKKSYKFIKHLEPKISRYKEVVNKKDKTVTCGYFKGEELFIGYTATDKRGREMCAGPCLRYKTFKFVSVTDCGN